MIRLEEQIAEIPHRLVPRVLILHGKYPGPNLWRCWWPSGYLSLRGFVVDPCPYEKFDEQRGLLENGRYNIVITPRIAFSSQRGYQQWNDVIRSLGITWVYDSDDDLWSPDFPDRQVKVFEGLPEAKMTHKEYDFERLQRIYVLKRVDAVTVSTDYLGDTAKKYTGAPIHTVPNLINVAAFESEVHKQRRDVPPLTVGWSGTRRQEDDLETVAAAWKIVAEAHPDVKFVVQGYQSPTLCRAVPSDRLVVMRAVDVNQYPSLLSNIDISCCSVSPDPWNNNKSPIKYFEATLAGSSCVVSKDLYGPYVRPGITGYVADTVDEWAFSINRLIEDTERRRHIQQNARTVILEDHSMQSQWPRWIHEWSSILDAKSRMELAQNANESESTQVTATSGR